LARVHLFAPHSPKRNLGGIGIPDALSFQLGAVAACRRSRVEPYPQRKDTEMLTYKAKLLGSKIIEPNGSFTRPTYMINLLGEDGETLDLSAPEETYHQVAHLPQLAELTAHLRARIIRTDKGRAFKLSIVEVVE